jgi:hypothetical protein
MGQKLTPDRISQIVVILLSSKQPKQGTVTLAISV